MQDTFLGKPIKTDPIITKPYFLGFHRMERKYEYWMGRPAIPYKVKGLLVWGVNETTRINQLQIGNIECLKAGEDPIPAILFAAGYSFEDFLKLREDENIHSDVLMGILREIPKHFPFQEAIDHTISLGNQVTIGITGPIAALVTWGVGLIDY